jgi:subtilisin family serine protease
MAGLTIAATATVFSSAIAGAAFAITPQGDIRGAGTPGAVADSYIVVLKDGTADPARVPAVASTLTRSYGGTTRHMFASSIRGFSARMTEAQARRFAANGEVAYVEQDRKVAKSDTQANPPSWGLDRIDQIDPPLDHAYNYYPSMASAVHAYVIDTGIRTTHQDFGGRASWGADLVANDPQPGIDCDGHGTHVAGTIGGDAYGVAKGVQLVAVKVLDCTGTGTTADLIAGIDWVTANAVKPAVANLSMNTPGIVTSLDNAVRRSIQSGIVYTVAAGNGDSHGNGVDACTTLPADTPEAITVGATDETDFRASYSNYGKCIDLFAPGHNIHTTANSTDTADAWASGTSMAAAHAAGAAALAQARQVGAPPGMYYDVRDGAVSDAVHNAGSGSPNLILNVFPTVKARPTIGLQSYANGRFVSAENGGNSPLIANRTAPGFWEGYRIIDDGTGYVALLANANGKYVTAENGGNSPLIARATKIGDWERFELITNFDRSTSLRAKANFRYVTAENGGNSSLIARATDIGPWEKFDMVAGSWAVSSLTAFANNRLVTADNAGRSPLIANRTQVGDWEEFDQIDVGNGYVALRSRANFVYVTAENGGRSALIARAATVGAWEKFQIIHNLDGSVSLRANANGLIVTAENGGNSPLIANRSTVGQWESFSRVVQS